MAMLLWCALFGMATVTMAPAGSSTSDPINGTWDLDASASTFNPGHAGTSAQSPVAGRQPLDPDFDAVLVEVEAAQVKLVNGQSDAFKALWSQSDDVTLSGGLGGAIAKGWPQVRERLDWVATQYVEGARTHQVVTRSVGQDLAYVVLRETIRFKRPTDRRSMIQDLRVTQIFRREGGRWRIVHRHADSETAKQTTG